MSVLDQIIVGVREDLERRRAERSLADLESALRSTPAPRDPLPGFTAPELAVIAEVKRRSPSKGDLAPITDPAALAQAYSRGGASTISVLTEERRFNGSLADLAAVRAAVETPLLRKDFMVDAYQFVEARVAGADLILLIVAALDQPQLVDLHATALELGLTPLVEVHEEDECARAAELGARLIGVNARNLKTLEVDPDAFGRLRPLLPEGVIAVAESGIAGTADAQKYADLGADVVLVGESLVKDGDPERAVAAMRAIVSAPAKS